MATRPPPELRLQHNNQLATLGMTLPDAHQDLWTIANIDRDRQLVQAQRYGTSEVQLVDPASLALEWKQQPRERAFPEKGPMDFVWRVVVIGLSFGILGPLIAIALVRCSW
jgi:hypothetical protein